MEERDDVAVDHAPVFALGLLVHALAEVVDVPVKPHLQGDRVGDGAELGGEDALGLGRADPVEQPRPSDRGSMIVETLGRLYRFAVTVDAVANLRVGRAILADADTRRSRHWARVLAVRPNPLRFPVDRCVDAEGT